MGDVGWRGCQHPSAIIEGIMCPYPATQGHHRGGVGRDEGARVIKVHDVQFGFIFCPTNAPSDWAAHVVSIYIYQHPPPIYPSLCPNHGTWHVLSPQITCFLRYHSGDGRYSRNWGRQYKQEDWEGKGEEPRGEGIGLKGKAQAEEKIGRGYRLS